MRELLLPIVVVVVGVAITAVAWCLGKKCKMFFYVKNRLDTVFYFIVLWVECCQNLFFLFSYFFGSS